NRVEVYAVVQAFHGGLADIVNVLGRHSGLDTGELYEHLYVHYAEAAVGHLFSVAAGLDSMVVGESQILGQVRAAYGTAIETGAVGPRERPLVVCDLGLPRDVAAEVAELAGVTIIDLESLQRRLASAPSGLDTRRATGIVAEEVRAYLATQRSAEVTPTVT